MIVRTTPIPEFSGRIELPASKSYSIRAFLIAACGGRSMIVGPSDCNDALVAVRVARFLGASVDRRGKNIFIVDARNEKKLPTSKINVGESGTVLRFLLPLVGVRDLRPVTVDGEGTLRGRPNSHLVQTLKEMGLQIHGQGTKESVPLRISGGALRGGKISIDGSLSSQFVSALLIACPHIKEDSRLSVKGGQMVSTDYIIMTRQVLSLAGIRIHSRNAREYFIKGNQQFKGLKRFVVPSDHGLAAFLIGGAAIIKSHVVLTGNLEDTLVQADGRIYDFLKKMGVKFVKNKSSVIIRGPFNLQGGVFSLKDCPDLVPIMTVLALFAKGRTVLKDIRHARVKESDRMGDLRKELLKVGAKITERETSLVIDPQRSYRPGKLLDPHNDHRLAMAFCVLGLKVPVSVQDIGCVSKSYPGFIRDFNILGAKIRKRP